MQPWGAHAEEHANARERANGTGEESMDGRETKDIPHEPEHAP